MLISRSVAAVRLSLAAGALVLATITAQAAPMADPYFDAGVIQMFWGSKQPSYLTDMETVKPGSPEQAALHLYYLNDAFNDAGLSLDKSFRNWVEVYADDGQKSLYPEVVGFGRAVGFEQLMRYLLATGGQHQLAMYSTGILSRRTQDLLSMHIGSP